MYPTNHIAYSINLGEEISEKTVEAMWDALTDDQKLKATDFNLENIEGNWKVYTEYSYDFSVLVGDLFFNRTGYRINFQGEAGLGQYDMVFTIGEEFENAEDLLFDRLPNLEPIEKQAFDTFFEEFFPGVQRGIRVFMTWC